MAEPHISELFDVPKKENNIPYKEVISTTVPPATNKPGEQNNPPRPNITQIGRDYWYSKNSNYLTNYQTGSVIGTVSTRANLDDFFNLLSMVIEEAARKELQKQNKTSEHLKNNFEMVKIALKVLQKDINISNVDANNFIAMLAGFINAYTMSTTYEN